ncbi:MAG: bacteriohemerythrin [Nitrospirota bacterium]|jgi:hemerythrin
MQWTQALSVGIDIIDEQHKELLEKINDLVEAIRSHTCKYKIGDVVKFLEDYVVFHFGEEEKFMIGFGYPGYEHHKAQHEEFMRNIERIKEILPTLEGGRKPGSYDLSVETNQLVVDWIIEHISQVDKSLGKFLSGKV